MSDRPPGAGTTTATTLRPRARFDLHLHSTRSDGRRSPEEVLRACAKGGLDVIAITDHDIDPALPPGPRRIDGRVVHLLHGAEVSGAHLGKEYHLLVYFPGEMPEPFRQLLRSLARARADRYEAARLGMGLDDVATPDAAARAGERAITRVHLSEAIVAAGHARDLQDAFDRYTGSRLARVPAVELTFVAAIRMARAAGGFTSWAHPPVDDAEQHVKLFASHGLQALEAVRPGLKGRGRSTLQRLAHKHGLLVTGGSDWHGFDHQRAPGSWGFPMREARPFARALGLRG